MRNQILMCTAAVCVAGAALNAQAPSPQAPPAQGQTTITGCVERADQMNAAGSAATTVDSLSFVLVSAPAAADAAPGSVGTSGTTVPSAAGARAKGEKPVLYRLEASIDKLNPHVGHKVEVTGTLQGRSADAAAEPALLASAPRLMVSSIKLIAETCPR